jgi:hypothetical protein
MLQAALSRRQVQTLSEMELRSAHALAHGSLRSSVHSPLLAAHIPLIERYLIMLKLPPILQGESLTRLIQGAAFGAVATIVVGFYWGGWVLGSTADKMSKQRSETAVVAVLAPVCAEKFAALPDAATRKVALEKAESWKRDEQFPKALITLKGESYPNSDLVEACYKLVLAQKAAVLK